jgi:K+-transporting ATPase ATPase C chain
MGFAQIRSVSASAKPPIWFDTVESSIRSIMSKLIQPPSKGSPFDGSPREQSLPSLKHKTLLSHVLTSVIYTAVSVLILGIVYPAVIWGIGPLAFPHQAGGSLIVQDGKPIGSEIIGQLFTKPQYFQGRPSAAGKNGYDPTSTGGTNLGPTSKKLIDATKAAIVALKKANPDAPGAPPMGLVTSSGSGIDPDISPEGAYYQAPRIAKARNVPLARVRALIDAHVGGRTFGILGEPRVNVLELNRALDGAAKP